MPKSGTLSKAYIIDAVAETNGYTRNKSYEIVEILLELVKAVKEFGPKTTFKTKFCFSGKISIMIFLFQN